MRTGYDSVTPANCPSNGAIYPAYVDGHWPNLKEMQARFPHKLYPTITVNGTVDALCADIELGDFSVDGGVRWARDRVNRHGLAWLYCNASTWPQVQSAVHAAGIAPHVRYWIAHYDRVGVIPQGAIGKQFLGDYHGYDQSVFADHIDGLDPVQLTPGWYVRELGFPIPTGNAGVTRRVAIQGHGVVPVQFGKDVMRVQAKVGARVDGLYGPGTAASVHHWQAQHGLAADGITGPRTAIRMGP